MKIENLKLKIVFFGTPPFVNPIIEQLEKNFNLVKVIRATDKEIPIEELQKLKPDLFVVAAFGKILSKKILDIPKFGTLNVHPSLLPKYRGPSPIQETILNGDKETGVSFIVIDEEVDHGPIIYATKVELTGKEDLEYLSNKLFRLAADKISEVITKYTGDELKPVVQNHKNATYCKTITKEDGFFELSNPPEPEKLDRMIRAYYPWPTAWTRWNGKIVKFLSEQKLQVEGKKPVSYKDFINGYPQGKEFLEKLGLL